MTPFSRLRSPSLLLLALLCAAPAAWGQSILSEGSLSALDAGAREREASLPTAGPDLEALFAAVERGRGAEVYETLRARYLTELTLAAAEGRDLEALRRRYLIHLLRAGAGQADPAVQEELARQFTQYYPDDEQFPLAFFYLNLALFEQGKPLEDSFFFDRAALETLSPWQQSRYLRMRADAAGKRGEYAQAAAYLLQEKESDTTLQSASQAEVEAWLERLSDPAALRGFLDENAHVEWLEERRPFLVSRVLVNAGRIEDALLQLEALQHGRTTLDTADLRYINALKAEIHERVYVRTDRVGVLLPLGSSSSFLRELARESLDGLRMAVQFAKRAPSQRERRSRLVGRDLQEPREPAQPATAQDGPPLELVVRDTGNNPAQAAEMVERLVREDQVVAIVGPLARAESSAAAARAEKLGVPLVSFSVSLDVGPDAQYTFRHNLSQEAEVRDLVRYAMDYLHARRFAVLYPDSGYGRTMAGLFWQAVQQRDGRIVAASAFTPSTQRAAPGREAVGLKEIFGEFTGLDRYVPPDLQKLIAKVGDPHPDPIVDFDALFIPTGPAGLPDLQLIAPYPVTVDAEHVLFLGSRFWNDDAVVVASDGKLDGAVFVDAYDRSSSNPRVAAFMTRHRAFFGHRAAYRAPSIYTALGYDTVNLLADLLSDPQHRSRPALARAMHEMQPYFGVTGLTRFKADGESEKESMFFRLDGNEIVRVQP